MSKTETYRATLHCSGRAKWAAQRVSSHFVNSYFVNSHFVNSHFVNSHFVNSHLVNFPFGQLPIWSLLTKSELTKWELTKWEVDKVGRFTILYTSDYCYRSGKFLAHWSNLLLGDDKTVWCS